MNDNPTTIGEITTQVTKKVQVSNLNLETYISTDNMLPNLGGIEKASGMPTIEKAKEFKAGDVLFSNIRTYFKKVWYARFDGGCSNDVLVFRGGKNVNSRFLYYIIADKNFIEYTVKTAKGTKMPRGDKDAIIKYGLNLPSFSEQKAIAYILGKLDDKIALNRQMNQTLEAMAQALFKTWFVDFDPVLDNALEAGHEIPEALQAMAEKRQLVPNSKKLLQTNPALAAQFPSSFVFNEVLDKWVPEGWEVKKLESISPCNKNSWTNKNKPQQVEYVDLSNTKNGDILETTIYSYEEAPSRAKRILNIGDTIFGTVRPGNRSFAYVGKEGLTGSTGFAVLTPLKKEYRSFTYLFTTQEEMIDLFAHLADGAAYPAINSSVIAESLIVYSGDELLSKFEKLTGSNILKMNSNKRELETLTQLRDRLLPELISGRVRVPEGMVIH
ncbi:restriction endonuclease subunit S [Algoriphagus antarcticus]|uniref:Type I restriction enzyme S subunit n=1 Tax=Algoriphagus antarcticus TaxID=238540 RepID=A0A3E0EBT4_9BACT|nr:restriction endonuclease subunit S [Algoriphagus antarcticus]REG94476.1 type I restriction enzyme S subunit [Algoriphagus antarcticus]